MAQAAWNLHPHAHARQKADVLLVTVTEMEAKAVLNLFPDHKACHLGPGAKTYYDLGLAADASVFMVQSEMGIGGAGGALLTVHEAISALSPSVVIMVGIAFGLKPKEQKVGDILVSTQICDYNQQKIDTSLGGQPVILTRGSRIPASASLLDRFRAGAKGWSCPASIHFGPILSGEKLINNQHYRDLLLGIEPEAIGGDMEGAALSTLGQLHKVDWVLVKAISDWADGEKDCQKRERQEEASSNAARFTTYVIRQGGFRKGDSGNGVHPPPPPSSLPSSQPEPGARFCTYTMHPHWVLALSWEPGGRHIASVGGGAAAHVWDTETARPLKIYQGHQHQGIMAKTPFLPTVYNVVWSPVDAHVASSGDGPTVHIWNASTGGTKSIYRGHSGLLSNVFAIAWSPDGQYIASACSSAGLDKTIHIWDIGTGQTVRRLATQGGLFPNFSVLALAWSPDGSRLAATCDNHTILLLKPSTGERIASYHVSAQWTGHLAWSPDGRFLATANSDRTMQVWDTSSHQLVQVFDGHTDSVRAVAWSPDGSRIASASSDTTVRIWGFNAAGRGTHLYTYTGHDDWATSVAWSPDGSRIASGSNDKTVHIWQAV
ncbi:MAG TPA: hypothetical protein VKV40_01010 [Ktedonobacteraceae bacterium]|nr:hypothetical protein [Ktedonobacteraceae bacterium]